MSDLLLALRRESSLEEVTSVLEALATSMTTMVRTERVLARERAIAALKNVDVVSSPARLVDAFLVEPKTQASGLALEQVVPSVDPQRTDVLLGDLRQMFERYIVLPNGASTTLAAWVLHTWTLDATRYTPRLLITSPAMRCGKTLVLDLLEATCARALQAAGVTHAVMFRAIEAATPTLLIDEADTFVPGNDELRGVLNAGFKQNGAILRCDGESNEPRAFRCFAPVALAAIGKLPSTIVDRGFVIQMARKPKGAMTARLSGRVLDQIRETMRPRLARWANDETGTLAEANPALPDALNDRQRDVAEPLLAIADLAGGEWPRKAREALQVLCSYSEVDAAGVAERLLRDIWAVLQHAQFMTNKQIVQALLADEEAEWNETGRDRKPLTTYTVGKVLAGFGIKSTQPREGNPGRSRGYSAASLRPAVDAYLNLGPTTGAVGTRATRVREDKPANRVANPSSDKIVSENTGGTGGGGSTPRHSASDTRDTGASEGGQQRPPACAKIPAAASTSDAIRSALRQRPSITCVTLASMTGLPARDVAEVLSRGVADGWVERTNLDGGTVIFNPTVVSDGEVRA